MTREQHHLKETRQRLGITIVELSRRSGISKNHIGRIERYENAPTLTTMCKLAWGLRLDVWEVFGKQK